MHAHTPTHPRRYLTRGLGKNCQLDMEELEPWPTCESHYDMVAAYSDFYAWAWNIDLIPHAAVHDWVGGVLDCEDMYKDIASAVGVEIAWDLLQLTMSYRKNLYCDGIFKCEGKGAGVSQKPAEVRSKYYS